MLIHVANILSKIVAIHRSSPCELVSQQSSVWYSGLYSSNGINLAIVALVVVVGFAVSLTFFYRSLQDISQGQGFRSRSGCLFCRQLG